MPETEKAGVKRLRCDGSGTPAKNVTRIWVGNRLPVGGDCQTCGQKVEITRKWTTKYHTVRVVTPPEGQS